MTAARQFPAAWQVSVPRRPVVMYSGAVGVTNRRV